MRMKFDQDYLNVEQNSYKAVKVYIVYDLDNWLKVSLRNYNKKMLVWRDFYSQKIVIKKSGCIVVME